MKKLLLLGSILILSCKSDRNKEISTDNQAKTEFTIAFGSCNNQALANELWPEILKNSPDLWIWGGDNVYADTENMQKMKSDYDMVWNQPEYALLRSKITVLGTWDDHDYGMNDGGVEFAKKDSAQQLLLDFLEVGKDDPRRSRKGIYHSKNFEIGEKAIKVIILDTRYFRTALRDDPSGNKRYIPNEPNVGTLLGDGQWAWLKSELKGSKADFNIIVSSIQFLSSEHGFETWGNMPHEVERMKALVANSQAGNVIFLSGDRHISEISAAEVDGLDYPLIDFTSSGLTHTYESFSSEPNQYRISEVVKVKNFGILKINLDLNQAKMELRGLKDSLLLQKLQQY